MILTYYTAYNICLHKQTDVQLIFILVLINYELVA